MRVKQALALDAFESVRLMPTSALLWHHLSALVNALEGDERAACIKAVADLPCHAREAQWLRCSALAYLTRDPVWFRRQAALVDATTPTDAVMSLVQMAWYHAVTRAVGHGGFVDFLQDVDVPRLQRLVAEHLNGDTPVRSTQQGSRLRVAIYTPEVANRYHGGTTLTLNTMSALNHQGVELHAFSAKEMSIPAIGCYYGGTQFLTHLPVDTESLRLNTSGSLLLTLPDTEFSLRARFSQMFHAINAYAPDVVVFVGFISPLVYSLHAHYPVVGLSVHALPPVAPVDVWLSADPDADAVCWSGITMPQVVHFPFRFWPVGQAVPRERATSGLPAEATVLITVGYRLGSEIAPPWSENMLAFLEEHPGVHWLLVGVSAGQSPVHVAAHPRVHLVGSQSNLAPWLAMCDIYVNPPRVGGGGALAMAMEQGLPVATFAGGDGGDKVGSYAVELSDSYFALLRTWVENGALRKQVGQVLKARFHERLDFSCEAAATGLMRACKLALESFQHRKETASA